MQTVATSTAAVLVDTCIVILISLGCSRHDSSRSMNRVELELEVIQETGEVDSSSSKKYENVHKKRDGPRDVRDYETMDHRALKQREEHRANYLASLGQRGVWCECFNEISTYLL